MRYANKLNKMNRGNNNKAVVNVGRKIVENGVQIISEKLNNDTFMTKSDIQAVAKFNDGALELSGITNVLRLNAIVAYVSGSEVGSTTKAIEKIKSIAIPNDVRAFKCVKSENIGSGTRYVDEDGNSQVFAEGVNIINATTEMGLENELFKVSYHELNKALEVLSKVDIEALTEEDLEMIKRDFDVLGRALQEISIDSAKDKTKAEGWAKVGDFFDAQTKALMDSDATNNFDEIKQQKYLIERDGMGELSRFSTSLDVIVPKDAYTEEEFNALTPEQQQEAMDTPVLCGLLGLAKMEAVRATDAVVQELVDGYSVTNSESYAKYAIFGEIDKQLCVYIKNVLDVIAMCYRTETKIDDKVLVEVRCSVYNEILNNKSLTTFTKQAAKYPAFAKFNANDIAAYVIKFAIAAAMANVKELKDGTMDVQFNAYALRFGTLTRLFKDEFIAEYAVNDNVYAMSNTTDVELALDTCNVDLRKAEGFFYVIDKGVATKICKDGVNVEDLAANTTIVSVNKFSGVAVVKDGKLLAKYNTNSVSNKEVGNMIVKDWFDTERFVSTGEIVEIDSKKLYAKDAFDANEILLFNNPVYVTGKDSNILAVMDSNGAFIPVARLKYAPSLISNGQGLVHINNIISCIDVANIKDTKSVSRFASLLTYTTK